MSWSCLIIPAAVKTGTSNDWRDAWAVGYTPDVTVGVWVGNSNNSPMQEIAGVDGAGVIWRDIMQAYNAGRPIRAFSPPPGIVEVPICADTGALAGDACPHVMSERFLAGTQPRSSDVQLQNLKVAGDGSCLPASYTPADQIHDMTFVVYPTAFHDWAVSAGIPQPPTKPCPPPATDQPDAAIALIQQPDASTTLTATQVLVRGTARGSYVLDVGSGTAPTDWQSLTTGPIALVNGVLAVWHTDSLSSGTYTLRLQVTTVDGVQVETRRVVQIQHDLAGDSCSGSAGCP